MLCPYGGGVEVVVQVEVVDVCVEEVVDAVEDEEEVVDAVEDVVEVEVVVGIP